MCTQFFVIYFVPYCNHVYIIGCVVAQLESIGGLRQMPWIQFPAAPPSFITFDVSQVFGR